MAVAAAAVVAVVAPFGDDVFSTFCRNVQLRVCCASRRTAQRPWTATSACSFAADEILADCLDQLDHSAADATWGSGRRAKMVNDQVMMRRALNAERPRQGRDSRRLRPFL